MKITKKKLLIYTLLAVIIPISIFILHERILRNAEPFGGEEIKQDEWWINAYNKYYITSSITISLLILGCIYLATYGDLRTIKKADYIIMMMCAWLILVNLAIVYFPFLPCIANLISILLISVICVLLIFYAEKSVHLKAFVAWALMILTIINNIWCMSEYFGVYGD